MAIVVSAMDIEFLARIRANVTRFVARCGAEYGAPGRLLDIAPQDHEGAKPHFPATTVVDTVDIAEASGCTYIGDVCKGLPQIPDGAYDYVLCTEVIEHVLQPFHAIATIHRLLKPGGRLFMSTPMNFRIHGPLPDCWRFTEHGLRALLADFELIELDALETPDRPLMPIQYTVIARRPL